MLLPLYLVRLGLGSKLSTWLTPPHMNSQMTFLALGVKCGLPSGLACLLLAKPSRCSMAASARPVMPMPVSARKERRVTPGQQVGVLMAGVLQQGRMKVLDHEKGPATRR